MHLSGWKMWPSGQLGSETSGQRQLQSVLLEKIWFPLHESLTVVGQSHWQVTKLSWAMLWHLGGCLHSQEHDSVLKKRFDDRS